MHRPYRHIPVLADEVIALLQPQKNQNFVDATLGGGGHARLVLMKTGPRGMLIGMDVDERAIRASKGQLQEYGHRVAIERTSYRDIREVVKRHVTRGCVSGVLLDLGLSSDQLDDSSRGFSFRSETSPDMRYDQRQAGAARDLLANASLEELRRIFSDYGDIERAHRLAASIVEFRRSLSRPFDVTIPMLVDIVRRTMPNRKQATHPATRVFQALRIAVNDELASLALFLPRAVDILCPGGRLAVIAYHSHEDRIVKNFFRTESRDCLCRPNIPVCRCGHHALLKVLTKKAVSPGREEIVRNQRARSAKLRVAEKI